MSLRNRDSGCDGVLCIVFSQEALQGSKGPWALVAGNNRSTQTEIGEGKEDERVGLEAGAVQGPRRRVHWWQGMVSIPSGSPRRRIRAGNELAVN